MKVTYGAIVQGASGRFGGTVHSNWKGVQVVRRFAKPSNPATVAQEEVRNAFTNLTRAFLLQPATMRAAWDSFVTGKPLINRNAWLGRNVPNVNVSGDAADLEPTPGDSSTLQPLSCVPTGANDSITFVVTAPAIPAGWSIVQITTLAVRTSVQWNTAGPPLSERQFFEASDVSSPYTGATITGLANATEYQTWAFIKWLAPDGLNRYSSAVSGGSALTT